MNKKKLLIIPKIILHSGKGSWVNLDKYPVPKVKIEGVNKEPFLTWIESNFSYTVCKNGFWSFEDRDNYGYDKATPLTDLFWVEILTRNGYSKSQAIEAVLEWVKLEEDEKGKETT